MVVKLCIYGSNPSSDLDLDLGFLNMTKLVLLDSLLQDVTALDMY